MLACRPRPRRLAALSFRNTSSARSNATSTPTASDPASASTSPSADNPQDSIFTSSESPWDHIFSDIEPTVPARSKGRGQHQTLMQRSSGVRRQRASLTAREMSVFNEMFDLIFNAVSTQDDKSSGSGSGIGSSSSRARTSSSAAPRVPSVSDQTPSIGRSGRPLNDLFHKLRRHTSRVRWTTAIDEELDQKKETMELFNTDHELLQWVTMELFGESQQWEEEANRVIAASSPGTAKQQEKENVRSITEGSSMDAAAVPSSSSPSCSSSHKDRRMNPSIYPHLIAHAMRIFRTTYANPSLSLAIFSHAARVSIPSYVFGCTAPAYNELIEAKWEGWGDLEGVCNALEEMKANGVKIDGRTRVVVETVRREVGEARPEGEGESGYARPERVNPLARRIWDELGEVEVARLVHRIEQLALRDRSGKSASPYEESWKSAILEPTKDDEWSFDGWEMEKQKQKTRPATRWTVLGRPEEDATVR